MGCDIHIGVEAYNDRNKKWRDISYYVENEYYDPEEDGPEADLRRLDPYTGRSYELFSHFAGVRDRFGNVEMIASPRGIPDDCTKRINADYKRWGADAHTPSWLTLKEIIEFSNITPTVKRRGMISAEQAKALDEEGIKPDSWCGWTNVEGYVTREWEDKNECLTHFIETVTKYLYGGHWKYSIDNLLENPEHIRFVFWFDN